MELIQNIPFFCIMITLFSCSISSVLPGKYARWLNAVVLSAVIAMSGWLLAWLLQSNIGSYTYMMGHFPAPWGNELRGGILEALMTIVFSLVILSGALGGMDKQEIQIDDKKQNLFSVMLDLVLAGMISMVYTNDLFTAYVFIEIAAITACIAVVAKESGKSVVASIRYLVFSCLGSGLVLLGISILYSITGNLLMESLHTAIAALVKNGTYLLPLTASVLLMTLGLSIKSAQFPFHAWLPDAHANATTSASAILSGLVLK
jgi:multicomponent Na+:H+ antiporter subunit D